MVYSLRIIRIIDDTFTVENEYEVEKPEDLVPALQKSQIGRKMLALLEKTYEGVTPKIPESSIAEAKRYDDQLREEGRMQVYEDAKKVGLDLERLLPKKEELESQKEETDPNPN